MFNHVNGLARMETIARHEREIVARVEGTQWGFCEMFQKAMSLYGDALPHVSETLPPGTPTSIYRWNTIYLNYFGFHSLYNQLLTGYYPGAGSSLRGVLESFVRMRYFEQINNDAAVLEFYQDYPTFCRSHGVRAIFTAGAPDWLDWYRSLCGFSHSGVHAIVVMRDVQLDRYPDSVIFSERGMRYIVDRTIPVLQVHMKALGRMILGRAPRRIERARFVTVVDDLARYTAGTPHETMIERVEPGALPA
jgi:hypothetical protein